MIALVVATGIVPVLVGVTAVFTPGTHEGITNGAKAMA